MRILIVIPRQPQASGNHVTARRHAAGLQHFGHHPRLIEVAEADDPSLALALDTFRPDLVYLLHAWRTGRPWLATPQSGSLPWLVTLTGTDINHDLYTAERGPTCRSVLEGARGIITQNPLTARRLQKEFPAWSDRLNYLPQGVMLGSAPYPLRQKHAIAKESILFLHPAGIRPVKGNLELLDAFAAVVAKRPQAVLAFCGPELDPAYAATFRSAVAAFPWAHYLGTIPSDAMATAMKEADVILNHSWQEGLPNALLEATVLGVPILARRIEGNAAVVVPNENGWLYDEDEQLREMAVQLIDAPMLRRRLSRPSQEFSPLREAEELDRIVCAALR